MVLHTVTANGLRHCVTDILNRKRKGVRSLLFHKTILRHQMPSLSQLTFIKYGEVQKPIL